MICRSKRKNKFFAILGNSWIFDSPKLLSFQLKFYFKLIEFPLEESFTYLEHEEGKVYISKTKNKKIERGHKTKLCLLTRLVLLRIENELSRAQK